jgi:hypothetical protein
MTVPEGMVWEYVKLYDRLLIPVCYRFPQVFPSGVHFFNQSELLTAISALDAFFFGNGFFYPLKITVEDQPVTVVFCGKPVRVFIVTVLIYVRLKVAGHSGV